MVSPKDIVYKPGFHRYELWRDTGLKPVTQYVLMGEEGSVVCVPGSYLKLMTYHVPSTNPEPGNENCYYLQGRDCHFGEVPEPDNAAELDEEDLKALMMGVYKDSVMGYWETVRFCDEVVEALS